MDGTAYDTGESIVRITVRRSSVPAADPMDGQACDERWCA